jgi:phage replication-related protein YjqB (UPF0714/DUF867 family)
MAGGRHSLYLFQACRPHGNPDLHLASDRFDDPLCLELAATHDWVLTVHGCGGGGEVVYLGGRDLVLKERLAAACRGVGLETVTEGHPWPGRRRLNICNRGRRGMGVQVELTRALRLGERRRILVQALQEALP